jgi:hypothetical protein
MVYRLRSTGFARQFDADIHTLFHRGDDRRISVGDRLVALDRLAGTTMIACTMILSVWLMSVAADAGLLRIPSATASSADTAAIEAQAGRSMADHLKWSEVRDVQAKLTKLSFDAGTVDGIAGRRTLDALNRYRAAQLLAPVSWVDRTTIADLLD